jgi:hypothetical protein
MFTHRLTRAAAVALAVAATAVPAANAKPIDAAADYKLPQGFQTADSRDAVIQRGLYEPMRPEDQPKPPQDLRMPDTVDYAEGRGTYNAPEVVVVETPKPAPQPVADGMDWADIGLGAGTVMGLSLIAVGGTLLVVRRRDAGQLAS